MEQMIKVVPERVEKSVSVNREPFLLADAQAKTVPLSMANGDQVISPDAGKLMSRVTVKKPQTLIPSNIVKNVNIGGVIGEYEGAVLPTLDNPASPSDVFSGKQYIDANGEKQDGSFSYPHLDNPASNEDVVVGKEYLDGNGARQTGVFDPDNWTADFLVLHHTVVTVGANNVTTTLGVKDYLLAQSGIDGNRLFAFCLREKPSYQIGELGRCVLYPNSTIGYFSASQWTANGWGTGRMLSGYSAVLPVGSVFDIYYWSV